MEDNRTFLMATFCVLCLLTTMISCISMYNTATYRIQIADHKLIPIADLPDTK